MSETAKPKPLWWRVGKDKWHEDPLTTRWGRLFTEAEIGGLERGTWTLLGRCGAAGEDKSVLACDEDVQTRRTAPPVAQQCQRCRAAKARKEKAK